MEWIEELFGISPDGGSGITEVMFLAALAVLVVGLMLRRRARARSRHPRS